jgi:hypothetical protein
MKTNFILSAIIVFSFALSSNAQAPRVGENSQLKVKWHKDGWIVDGGVGMRAFGKRSEDIERIPGLALHGGIGYKFNSIWGIRGRMDYFNHILRPGFQNADQSMAHTIGLSLMGTADLIPWITGAKGTTWHLITYLGAGLNTSWNPDVKNYVEGRPGFSGWEDPAIGGHDDMGHFIVGLTPQYHFSSRFALTADISTMLLMAQDFTFDYGERLNRGNMGAVMNFSLGFVFYPHF